MITVGQFYMHDRSVNMCVLVLRDYGSGTYEVQWWDLGYNGTPSPTVDDTQRIYMHPTVWTNITTKLKFPTYEDA